MIIFQCDGSQGIQLHPRHILDLKCDLGGDTVVKFKSHLDSNIKAPTPILIPGLTAYRMGDSNSLMNWSSSLHFNNNIMHATLQNAPVPPVDAQAMEAHFGRGR